jgi:methylase of polypeptide subunit release factors
MGMYMSNEYSEIWFDTFLKDKNAAETESEVNFLLRQLPIIKYKSILDLCCGFGRYANALAQNGYSIVGVDRGTEAFKIAEKSAVRALS